MENNISNNKMALGSSAFTAFLCILFGANTVAIKFSLTGLGPFTNAGLRFSIAVICIFIWSKIIKKSLKINKKQFFQLLILSIIFVIQSS